MTDQPLNAEIVDLPMDAAARKLPWWREIVDNQWLMIGMLFFVTAALGLPLLWISRGFSTWAKVVLTFAVLAWTALVFWVFFLIMAWCWSQLRPVFMPGSF
jgi:hypothetical protein